MYLRILTILFILTLTSCDASSNITCEFAKDNDIYTAIIRNQSYDADTGAVKIFGRHILGHKNHDVTVLDISEKNVQFGIFPQILFQIFFNLTGTRMKNCGLKRILPFRYCDNMKNMEFGGDTIEVEPGAFKACKNLETLEFDANRIERIDALAFKGLFKLKVLKMHDCNMHVIEAPLLIPLMSLEEIHITKNQISELPKDVLEQMHQLRVMNFSNNELTTFSAEYLKSKNHLESVDVSGNNIEHVDRQFLEDWPNNAELNILSNACVDKKFGKIGTNELPIADVVELFMNCFTNKDSTSTLNISAITLSEEQVNEGLEIEEASILPSEVESEEDESEVNEDKLSVEPLPTHTPTNEVTHDHENIEDMTDSPYDFAIEASDAPINGTDGETPAESSEYSDESDETTTTTTTPEPETTTLKKRKKKSKKVIEQETTVEPPPMVEEKAIEPPIVAEEKAIEPPIGAEEKSIEPPIVAEEKTIEPSIDIEESTKDREIEEPTIQGTDIPHVEEHIAETEEPKLHEYEQSTCRFYTDADKNYNCELIGVTEQLKRINTHHSDGYSNLNVTGIYFSDSKLFHVPTVVAMTFPNLELLSIKDTNLKVMDDEFIKECGRIKRINLVQNRIRYVDKHSVKSCLHLQHIDLSKNPIEKIESGIFMFNPHLSIKYNDLNILSAHDEDESNEKE